MSRSGARGRAQRKRGPDSICSARVILAAFTFASSQPDRSILNPCFLVDAAGLALAKQTNPRGQQPARDQAAHDKRKSISTVISAPNPVGDRAAHNGVARHDERKNGSPQISRNQPRRPAFRRMKCTCARIASRRVSLCSTSEIWTEQNAMISPLMTKPLDRQVIEDVAGHS